MLPPEFLNPILIILKGLVDNYSISVLLSTATQPALTGKIGGSGQFAFEGIADHSVRELVHDVDELAIDLKRVEIQPVSYTHLDVYKRQLYRWSPCWLA